MLFSLFGMERLFLHRPVCHESLLLDYVIGNKIWNLTNKHTNTACGSHGSKQTNWINWDWYSILPTLISSMSRTVLKHRSILEFQFKYVDSLELRRISRRMSYRLVHNLQTIKCITNVYIGGSTYSLKWVIACHWWDRISEPVSKILFALGESCALVCSVSAHDNPDDLWFWRGGGRDNCHRYCLQPKLFWAAVPILKTRCQCYMLHL